MSTATVVDPKNSTTVRLSLTRAAEWLAPQAVLDRAWEAWATPPRRKVARAPRDARMFELDTTYGPIKAYEWGMRDDGEVVLLVHGWAGSAAQMEKLSAPLTEAGRQVVALDLPAHGLSPGKQTNLVEMAAAVEAALWRFRPSAVIAHSLGATATVLALENGPHVERLVLLAPGEDMTYFAHAFAARAGLSQGIALGLLARVRERIGVEPEAMALRHHAPPAITKTLLVHDPADDEVPWSHAQRLAHAWGKGTTLLAALGAGHHGMPRAKTIIEAATSFVVDGVTRGEPILSLTGS